MAVFAKSNFSKENANSYRPVVIGTKLCGKHNFLDTSDILTIQRILSF